MNKTKTGQTNIKARLPCLCFRVSDLDAPFQRIANQLKRKKLLAAVVYNIPTRWDAACSGR